MNRLRPWGILTVLLIVLACALGNLGLALLAWRSADLWAMVHLLSAAAALLACLVLIRQVSGSLAPQPRPAPDSEAVLAATLARFCQETEQSFKKLDATHLPTTNSTNSSPRRNNP